MKGWICDESRPIPRLKQREVPTPTAGPGEIVIRVLAAGVTPSELHWFPTTHTSNGEPRRDAIPGHEFSGVVAEVGPGAEAIAGEEVFGMSDWFLDGATAEFCITRPHFVVTKPPTIPHADASAAPIGALTAWQGLFDRAYLEPNETVLIHGGSGGVGIFAIQLAKRQGARVITTASAKNREILHSLGADQVIDYHTERFEDLCRDVDVVFDGVGGDTLQHSWDVLTPSGRLVTIAASSEYATDDRTKNAFFIVEPNQNQLTQIAGLLETRELRSVVDTVASFHEADLAYSGQLPSRKGLGKVVIDMTI